MTFSASDKPDMTLPSEQRDFVEWRKGRTSYAVWALDVATAEVKARSERLREAFASLLLPGYVRQAHVTLALCGFPAKQAVFEDDYLLADLVTQFAALRAAYLAPFSIRIGRPDSFASAAYFSVADRQGGIERLRRALVSGHPADTFPYVPHVSFGLYRQTVPLRRLVEDMLAFDEGGELPLTVSKLVLMSYEAARIGGPLRNLAEFDLRGGGLAVLEPERLTELFGETWQTQLFA